ncbi:MAG: isoleucine--tRNA ligase [Phycisphaeraceae bacterium]|nr:MAG: isoleucine--tRNA ligase [Phycisphaeraceae bacterium]
MTDTATTKPNYKNTLNLPRTDFPMKANLSQNEPQSVKRWAEARLYDAIMRARAESASPPFVFHDGPPYANGDIHVGHLLNKVLKDIVVRTRLMEGSHTPYVPGWDCHGLPIEHKVMTDLIEKGKMDKLATLPDDQRRMVIRRECQKYAEKYVKLQAEQMKRLLTLADYDHPYMTMAKEYEAAVLEVFATLVERGLVYRALKAVHWSIANETALAEAELEYYDREDLSIYVDFEAADREAVGAAFGVELDETPSFMIWTTTPWTLPANLAIAVNPRFTYALVRIDGALTIVAREAVERITKAARSVDVEVLAETAGEKLVGLRYRHPFVSIVERAEGPNQELTLRLGRPPASTDDLGAVSTVVAADYVTLEDGTGLVHTAPGHGQEDYQTGLRVGLPIYCPVRKDGTYDDTVPEWLRGMSIWDANEKIRQHLETSGHLFFWHTFTHSYPHDWRGKSPVIFRATEQWFVSVDKPFELSRGDTLPSPSGRGAGGEGEREGSSLRTRALAAASSEVQFIPEWGRNRMRGMLESRPDWCLSRQRAWGVPIPAFEGPDGQVFLTAASVRAVAKVVAAKGSDAWFTDSPEQLLAHYDATSDPDAPDWVRSISRQPSAVSPLPTAAPALRKMHDIFDVWFESGSSWAAVLHQRGLARTDGGPSADLYLEGSDQHRGWFQASLLPSIGVRGVAPYKALLTHGFIVDKDGRKMSKSLGNTLEVEDLLKDHGADVCRWWVSSLAFENDIKMDAEFFRVAGESYRKVRNTLRFLLSNLSDFVPGAGNSGAGVSGAGVPPAILTTRVNLHALAPVSLDAYALAMAAKLQHEVRQAYLEYRFRDAHQALYDFCNDTLSAVYCAAVKDRLYCDRPDSPRRRATQTVMWEILEVLTRLLAPLMPHTAEEAAKSMGRTESIHLTTHHDLDVACDADWPRVLEAREQALKALEAAKQRGIENPLDAGVTLPDPDGVLKRFSADLADLLGVSRVGFDAAAKEVFIHDLRNEPRCERSWRRDGTVKLRSDGGLLCDRCAAAVGVA